jgi:hypothetical protein
VPQSGWPVPRRRVESSPPVHRPGAVEYVHVQSREWQENRKMGAVCNSVRSTTGKYNQNNQVQEDEMGRSCSMNGGRGMCIGYWCERQGERDH